VNVKVISAKKMVQAIRDKRELSAVSTELLGRVMLSAMLVANGIKDEETLQLTFSGDGAAKGVMAISDGACNVRAWIGNSDLDDLKDPETGRADIKAAVGKGTLQVVKNHPSWRIPYNGVVQIASGEVAPDVAFYLASSEQRNTALGVGLSLDPKTGEVESAGGFYIEMMPGVEEESVLKVEVNLAVLKERFGSVDPGVLFAGKQPVTPYMLVKMLLDGRWNDNEGVK
jgi:molecular chaperone Hsp33